MEFAFCISAVNLFRTTWTIKYPFRALFNCMVYLVTIHVFVQFTNMPTTLVKFLRGSLIWFAMHNILGHINVQSCPMIVTCLKKISSQFN